MNKNTRKITLEEMEAVMHNEADMTQEEYDSNPTRMYMNGQITKAQWERMLREEIELAIAQLRAER